MISLFIDTSSSDVSIAILNNNKILSSIQKTIPNQHSIYTVSFIDKSLKSAKLKPKDIQKIMVVTGPGSFTGVRIGVTIAKVYAYLEKIEIIPISSLKSRSISCSHDYCLSIIDAHHDNYYIGLYNKNNEEVIKEQFLDKKSVVELIEKYHPKIVSDLNGMIDKYEYPKQELDIPKIEKYYQKEQSKNPHMVNPNYLKLPQALEVKKD